MATRPRFRFVKVNLEPSHRLSSSLLRLGAKVRDYANALENLSQAGSREAKIAKRLLSLEAQRLQAIPIRRARRILENGEFTPKINLDPGSRWRLDGFGLVTLQLLLWLWQARREPVRYRQYGALASNLEPFHKSTMEQWWRAVRIVLTEHYPKHQYVPKLKRLVTPESYQGDSRKRQSYILRKIRERLASFAIPD